MIKNFRENDLFSLSLYQNLFLMFTGDINFIIVKEIIVIEESSIAHGLAFQNFIADKGVDFT